MGSQVAKFLGLNVTLSSRYSLDLVGVGDPDLLSLLHAFVN